MILGWTFFALYLMACWFFPGVPVSRAYFYVPLLSIMAVGGGMAYFLHLTATPNEAFIVGVSSVGIAIVVASTWYRAASFMKRRSMGLQVREGEWLDV